LDDFDPTYLVSLDEIYHSHWAARKKRRITYLRDAVAHFWPQGHPSRLIHITGTNGKGSVAHYLAQGLRFTGITGSWTGPHVFDYAERFHINGEQASHGEISEIYRTQLVPYQARFVEEHDGASLSFAEIGILLALHLFARHGVSWAIMEVGAGGRYTPLMGLSMDACALTNVGFDHPKTLGEMLWQRALEKAGIARVGIPFFTAAEGEALSYVVATAQAEGAPVQCIEEGDLEAVSACLDGEQPPFRIRNLALACKLIVHFFPGQTHQALVATMKAHLPARFSQIAPNIIVDVAHNRDKVARLAEQLQHRYPGRRFRFLLGLTRSRNVCETFAPILPLADRIVLTGASYAGQDPQLLAASLREVFPLVHVIPDPETALAEERKMLTDQDILVLTGSAYMIDQAANPCRFIKETNASYGRRTNTELS